MMIFFQEKSHFVQAQIQFISFDKGKANSTIEQQKWKGQEKRDGLLGSEMVFDFDISQRNKKNYLLIQFSQIGLILSKKCQL